MKKQITKSYLEYLGVTNVTEDGRVFTENGERKPQALDKRGSLAIQLHDAEKYKSISKEKRNSSSGKVNILVHQVVFAWFNNEVPYNKEIHHIDGNHLNNSIDNLEALTHEEHVAKHGPTSTRELKCRLDVPRSWYENKLKQFTELRKKAKAAGDLEAAERARSAADHTRARLRYYDSHIEEANKLTELKKDCMELASWKKVFKENGNNKLWHQCCSIEKMVKEKGLEVQPVVKHALEVTHRYFGKE